MEWLYLLQTHFLLLMTSKHVQETYLPWHLVAGEPKEQVEPHNFSCFGLKYPVQLICEGGSHSLSTLLHIFFLETGPAVPASEAIKPEVTVRGRQLYEEGRGVGNH